MFFIELILTRDCNQKCSYCTTYTIPKNKPTLSNSDLEFIKNIKFPKNSFIEITGGEVGLIDNLIDVIDIIKLKGKKIRIMSNGLVRKKFPEIIQDPNILYCEHLFENSTKKFYNLEPFSENNLNNYNVIVTTEDVIDNIDNFKNLIHKNTWLKMVNFKGSNHQKGSKFINFYKEIKDKTYINLNLKLFNINEKDRKFCSINPPTPFINIQERTIGHCAKILNLSKTVSFTEENFEKLKKSELFGFEDYCSVCDDVNFDNRIINKIKSRKGKFVNT